VQVNAQGAFFNDTESLQRLADQVGAAIKTRQTGLGSGF
jgi:hypothetical protein